MGNKRKATTGDIFNKALLYANSILDRLRRFENGSASLHDNEKNPKAIICRASDVFDYETLTTLSLWSTEHAVLIYDNLIKMDKTRLPKANEVMHEYTEKRIKQCVDGTFEERLLEDVVTAAVFPHPPIAPLELGPFGAMAPIKCEKKAEVKKLPREAFFFLDGRSIEEDEGDITAPPFVVYVNEAAYFEETRAKSKTWEDPDETMVDPDFWNLLPSREKPVKAATAATTTMMALEKGPFPFAPVYYPPMLEPPSLHFTVKKVKEEEEEKSESAIIHFKGSPEETNRWLTNYVKLCEEAKKILFELGRRLFSIKEEPKPESEEAIQIAEAYARLERLAETSSDVAFSIWRGLSIEHRIVLANPASGQSNRSAHLKTLRIVKISAERP